MRWIGIQIIRQSVARQGQPIDCRHNGVGIGFGIGIVGVCVVDFKLDRFGLAHGEIGSSAIGECDEFAPIAVIGLRIILKDEAACPADHVKAHQFAPVIGLVALFKGGD
jgi:hypothetical protein